MSSVSPLMSKDSVCGKTMFNIVGHGNSIIAEIQRLAKYIPDCFYLQKDLEDYELIRHIILDFAYQKKRRKYDDVIQNSRRLLDLDENFKENFIGTLERFFLLFQNIYNYYCGIQKFLKDLSEGVVFVDQNLEKILKDRVGKQLICEMVFLYGVMLLLLDQKIRGIVRERMLMSYYRYMKVSDIDTTEFLQICKLMGRTEVIYKKKWQKLPEYPVKYFARFPFPKDFMEMILSKLRTDDIYNMTSYFPFLKDHTHAKANQAGLLYIMLYFQPETLRNDFSSMRSIVDNYFNDNWVISYYIGFTVDLCVQWARFKAAARAVGEIVFPQKVKDLTVAKSEQVKSALKDLAHVLTDGVLTEEYVLDHVEDQIKILRKVNICLRWLILHRTSRLKKIQKIVHDFSSVEEILLLLLNGAQYEYVLQCMFEEMIAAKEKNWNKTKDQAKERMRELSSYFSGEEKLTAKNKNEQLQKWFLYIEEQIDSVNYSNYVKAGNKLHEIIQSLQEVEEFKSIYQSLQVKQYLLDTRKLLKKMIRYVNIQGEVLSTISILSDISYGWGIINDYVPLMQQKIIENPSLIIKMRSTFKKLSTMMQTPCVRIQDAGSVDLISVSGFYSNELVNFVRKTLEIIPVSMFKILDRVVSIHTTTLNRLPTTFNREDLKDLAQLNIRDELAKFTYKISEFTEGVLAMKKTLFGIIEVDPKQLLEDGVRKQLVVNICSLLHKQLTFHSDMKRKFHPISDFESRLKKLSNSLNGMCRSFEYIQDYILVYGLKLWHEEFSRIINYNVEMECNRLLKNKVQDWQSMYQSEIIPIPVYRRQKGGNFMGRVLREVLIQTDPKEFIYFDKLGGWFDLFGGSGSGGKSSSKGGGGKENFGMKHFFLLEKSIGVNGLKGMDTILSFRIVKMLEQFSGLYKSQFLKAHKKIMESFRQSVEPLESLPDNMSKVVSQVISKLQRPFNNGFTPLIMSVGRAQLIRKHIAYTTNFSCKLNANLMLKSMENLNDSILNEIQDWKRDNSKSQYPSLENPLLAEMDRMLEQVGLTNPFEKVYITNTPLPHLGIVLALYIISQMAKFQFNPKHHIYLKIKKNDYADYVCMQVGLVTILRQYNVDERILMFKTLAQFIRAGFVDAKSAKFILRFVRTFSKFDGTKTKNLERYFAGFWFSKLE